MRILLILMAFSAHPAVAAKLVFVSSITDPESLGVRIEPQENEQVTALQFDLRHPALAVAVSPGSAAVAVQKTVLSSQLDDSRTRVLIFGMNRTGLPEGLLVLLKAAGGSLAPGSAYSISLSHAVASDSEGRSLAVTVPEPAAVHLPTALSLIQVAPLAIIQDGWTTSFRFTNLSGQPNVLRMEFFSASGAAQPFPSEGVEPASTHSLTLQPRGAALLHPLTNQSGPPFSGWARVSADGPYTGAAILRRNAGDVTCEAALPLTTETMSGIRGIQWDRTGGASEGIALANPSDTVAIEISLLAYDAAGSQIDSGAIQLEPRTQAVFALREKFPLLPEGTGTVLFASQTGAPFGLLALRFNASGCFASLPVFEK